MNRSPKKVIAYIDGFNLYFGMKSKNWSRYFWLDIWALSERLVQNGSSLIAVKYFTSRINNNPAKVKRQNVYLEALSNIPNVRLLFGNYVAKEHTCSHCSGIDLVHNEKMTDVTIAVELLADAVSDQYDDAIIISGDSDLSPAVKKVKLLYPAKRVHCWFPPNRHSKVLQQCAHSAQAIGRGTLSKSQLPNSIALPSGILLERPASWK